MSEKPVIGKVVFGGSKCEQAEARLAAVEKLPNSGGKRMSKTIKQAVTELSQDMNYLELECENDKLKYRIRKLEIALDAALDQCRQHCEAYEKNIKAWRKEAKRLSRENMEMKQQLAYYENRKDRNDL